MAHQIVYRLGRELGAKYNAKMGYELRYQGRRDLGLVNRKMGGGLKGTIDQVPTSLPILRNLDSFEGLRTCWIP